MNALSSKVREHIINIYATGESTDRFVRDLMKDFSTSYNNAKRLAVTELAHYTTQATIDGYIKLGVTKYKVITERDCWDKCSELSNKVFDINDPTGYVPNHCFCRCSVVAVM